MNDCVRQETYYGGFPMMLRYVNDGRPVTDGLSSQETAYRLQQWETMKSESEARRLEKAKAARP
jgi:hypothetical protein